MYMTYFFGDPLNFQQEARSLLLEQKKASESCLTCSTSKFRRSQ